MGDPCAQECRAFVSKCLVPEGRRPTAMALLEDPFLAVKKITAPGDNPDLQASLNASSKRCEALTQQLQGVRGPVPLACVHLCSLHDAMLDAKRKTEDAAGEQSHHGQVGVRTAQRQLAVRCMSG